MKNKFLIITGDPNSINSEIIYKTWNKISNKTKKKIYLIGSYKLLSEQFKQLRYKIKIKKVKNIDEKSKQTHLKILDIPLIFKNPFKIKSTQASKYIIKSFNLAHTLAMQNKVKGIINCPINKDLIKKTKKIGVTELLASKCELKPNSEVMMLYNKKLSVVPLTTHISIRDIPKTISKNLIIKKTITLNREFKKIFKKKPKIGILGLNPHNGELKSNSEEKKFIIPAIKNLINKKFNVFGPLVADTIFVKEFKKYDVLVGMYHDQVLAPFKSLYHFDAINITLGLKYIRMSPDHGPAANIMGSKKANCLSLVRCVELIDKLKK